MGPARPAPFFPSTVRSRSARVDGIDGLRTFAVMLVIVYHFHPDILPGGSIGVDIFYTISGFVITRLLIAEFARTGDIGLRQFYRRRWLRLVPALLVVCALTAVLTFAPVQSFRHGWSAALLAAASLVNIVRAMQPGAYSGVTAPLGHTWSLGVEEQFYLLWPPVLLGLLRRLSSRAVLVSAGVLTLLPVLWRYHLWQASAAHRIYNGPDTRADQLLAGAVLAILLARLHAGSPWRERLRTWSGRLWLPSLAVLALIVWQVPITGASAWNKAVYTVGFLVIALLTVVLLTSLELQPRAPLNRVLSLVPLAWVGRNLSYGLYLWHYPLMHLLSDLGVRRMLFPSTLLATFIMATASYYLVEEPCRRMKHRRRKPRQQQPQAEPAVTPASASVPAPVALAED
ncbi:Peptidoglycan/LPS O-acetylase OafA/YrhL, contains acyltransferase and SGNH-hydrolase domains [Actinacidiphila guanduensis]|uniref:Peptidoglycan/LPS O-acetylase OafA/YrhL, contains acyltransferase and SGNH-hydrolase domains n=1 Tax=Actinacidiphila guanduensis TaxID=310781 RepID=A0A1H0LBY9_9ACTN|nr:Peptidoglycan/LPS O-acetylase OafA/YrhL, contains acyltransferase and SGNH-hydrolase domains [Actinacidiphila guanduensis]